MRSAPTLHSANKGLDDRQIKLGCVQPGERNVGETVVRPDGNAGMIQMIVREEESDHFLDQLVLHWYGLFLYTIHSAFL